MPRAMAELLGIRAYARRRGINHSAVQKAISSGRLEKSLTKGKNGRVRIHPEKADAEWSHNTNSTLVRRGVPSTTSREPARFTARMTHIPKNGTGNRKACWSMKLYVPYQEWNWLR